jgi:SAM-dependent methyltransferase
VGLGGVLRERPLRNRRRDEFVDTAAPDLPRRRALDFGCGAGRLTQPLADRFDHAVGVDIAPSMIARAKGLNRAARVANSCSTNATAWARCRRIPSISSTRSLLCNTCRRDTPAVILREFVRILAPGGILLFQLPGRPVATRHRVLRIPLPGQRLYRRLFRRAGAVMDMFGMSPDRVRALLEAAGCEVVAVLPDRSATGVWEGYRHCARKRPE